MIEDSGYPMSTSQVPTRPRRLIIAESGTVESVRHKLEQLAIPTQKKRGLTRRELTPPVQDDTERGEGDSINSRLHRLLHPETR